jgi:hypothetical protein
VIQDFRDEFERDQFVGRKAIAQVPDRALIWAFGEDNNSLAVVVRHISGNLVSRFTDFLGSDGEKPWRNRDSEFEYADYDGRNKTPSAPADGVPSSRNSNGSPMPIWTGK